MATPTAAPSYSQRAKEQGLPILISREQIAEMGPVTWVSAEPSEARNPQSGEMGHGLLAVIEVDGQRYQTFVGNVALLKDLATIDEDSKVYTPRAGMFPFTARLVKSGRTWVFSD